jgi:acetyl-CoA acetyltransferase
MPEAVILEAVRTPFARCNGVFRDYRPDSLLAHVSRGVVERGGAIAHGHPLGATGGTLGLQVMCIGHGMATATVVERIQ